MDSAIDSIFFRVHCSDKSISEVAHHFCETEEEIALKKVAEGKRRVPEAVVESSKNLVHALNVHHTGVETSIQEQDTRHDISVSDDVVLLEVPIQICFLLHCLSLQLNFIVSLGLLESICEKLHICSRPPNIFFNFLPDDIVHKVLVPNALFLYT